LFYYFKSKKIKMDSPKENQISFEELTKITTQVRDEKKNKNVGY